MTWVIPDNTVCCTCHCRPATQIWTSGTISLVHGDYAFRCELCCLQDQLVHARKCVEELPKIEAKIKELEKVEIANA